MSYKFREADIMVLRALRFGPKTQPQLAEHTTFCRETIRQSVNRLKAQGRISGNGGLYALADVQVAA